MRNRIILTSLTLILALLTLSSCSCNHNWQEATCTKPQTCKLCGETKGNTVDHVFTDASCTSPQTCLECGYTTGSMLDHEYSELTCATRQVCKICSQFSGITKEHNYAEASCTSPKTCFDCGKTSGEPLGHNYSDATYTTPQTCTNCGNTQGDILQLSDSCDKVLASGYEENGDFYQLVANESESYNGVYLEIGIIKNNSWLLPLTNKMPLIDEDGTIFGQRVTSIYDEKHLTILYIGNGCFLCESISGETWNGAFSTENIIYNCKTQDYFIKEFSHSDNRSICLSYNCIPNYYDKLNYDAMHKLNFENSLLITDFISYSNNKAKVEILDTNSMTSSSIEIGMPSSWINHIKYVYPMSDGLFAVTNDDGIIFYDVYGRQIIQKNYKLLSTDQNIIFIDGKCTFDILNNNDTPFTITIDEAGNVLTSTKKEQ